MRILFLRFVLIVFLALNYISEAQIIATLPYTTNFSNPVDNAQWRFRNVNESQTASWKIQYSSLICGVEQDDYIVENHPVTVLAERIIRVGACDKIQIDFNVSVGGEQDNEGYFRDFLSVFFVPMDTVFEPSFGDNLPYYLGDYVLPCNVGILDCGGYYKRLANVEDCHILAIADSVIPHSDYKLIFVWHNDSKGGDARAVMIDNLSVVEVNNDVVNLPYFTSFSNDYDNAQWTFRNGFNFCSKSEWYIENSQEKLVLSEQGSSFYDNTNEVSIFAERRIRTDAGDYINIDFDLDVEGDYSSDAFLRIFVLPDEYASIPSQFVSSACVISEAEEKTEFFEAEGVREFYDTVGYISAKARNTNPNSVSRLVFQWKNAQSSNIRQGVFIDNLRVYGLNGTSVGYDGAMQKSSVSFYPNPARDYVFTTAEGKISVYNSLGQKLKETENKNEIKEIDLRDLEAGLYIIKHPQGIYKLIIEK
ncbi:MAG: T9SS type A sorting domain-containing protein [Bacteroidales bacterium]|nr:T9SS type A sorting domain-containing protein [Bacteroidales bacterium]